MTQTNPYVGIDVSKAHLDIRLTAADCDLRVANDPAGWAALAQRTADDPQAIFGLEL